MAEGEVGHAEPVTVELEQAMEPVHPKVKERIAANPPLILYTNSAEIRAGYYDFVFELGFVEEATKEKLVIRDVAKLVMSPQHAKALAGLLNAHIKAFEALFGPIPPPLHAKQKTPQAEG